MDCFWPTVPVRVVAGKRSLSSITTPADGRLWAARRTYTVGHELSVAKGGFRVGCGAWIRTTRTCLYFNLLDETET